MISQSGQGILPWLSVQFLGTTTVISPSNTKEEIEHKVELYLAKGALEVWVVNSDKEIAYHTHAGQTKKSKIVPKIKL